METKTPQSAFEEELLLLRAERKAKRAHIELKANLNVQDMKMIIIGFTILTIKITLYVQ